MRLSTDDNRDDSNAAGVIAAALEAGVTVFDTARAYGRGEAEAGHNERLLAGVIRRCGAEASARIVTKGGMTRLGGAWVPDGRAKTILGDCEASLADLGGLAIDTFLVHAPDPRTPWSTSVRALARLVDDGVVERVGVSNVNRRQLDEALELAPISAVEVALSVLDDRPLRGGVVERCAEMGITVIAHSPLGGPGRARELARRRPLADVAAAHGTTPAEVALAWLLELSPTLVAIPGARRPETAAGCARAAALELEADDRAQLDGAFGDRRPRAARQALHPRRNGRPRSAAEVVVVMGIPGAGKTRVAAGYVAGGYARLNRDERGGGLAAVADALGGELRSGVQRVVLDNTYLTRASRSYVIDAADRHAVPVRCVWVDTPLAQAQVNLVERLLDRFDALPPPDDLRTLARREPGVLAPTSQMRALRELEPPSTGEGFARVDVMPFARADPSGAAGRGVFVAGAALRCDGWEPAVRGCEPRAPHLVFDWVPEGDPATLEPYVAQLAATVTGPVRGAICPHPAGPPACWCRPPLPGLLLAFARRHALHPARCTIIGVRPAHRTLAATLGARYVSL
jgi:aryl-alcohol dehydrogenase-like predicted oxidoreductase/predicted kinase